MSDLILTPTGLRAFGRRIPVSIGRGGVTRAKREGDGATPAGVQRITGCLWRADRLPRPCCWATPIGPRDLWSDDPEDAAYNRPVTAPYPASAERLRRADGMYDIVLTTDWNAGGVPHAGSAIFLHVWRGRGRPTAGCVAMARPDLLWLLTRLAPGDRLVV